VAIELDYIQQRRRWRRNGAIAGGVVGAVLAAMLLLRFGRGGYGWARRPHILISPNGITVDGAPATIATAITACRDAGSCDVRVTGDTRQGDWDAFLQALVLAGVKFYVH
jgi:hypothetical protein